MRVAFTYNVRHTDIGLDPDAQAEAEFDEPETIATIHAAVEANGHTCVDVEADEDAYETLRTLRPSIDLVLNIAEGRRGESREAQLPAMLEMLGIPFTHSGSLAHAISLNKALTKQVWRAQGLPTPRFVGVGTSFAPLDLDGITFPVVVKPNAEGSSKGVFDASLVDEPSGVAERIREIRDVIGGDVLIEEYVGGREFTVTVMGNAGIDGGVYTLPIMELDYSRFPDDLRHIASYEAKWFFEVTDAGMDAWVCPADVTPALADRLSSLACRAYLSLSCRDVARVDIRLDDRGEPQLIEINTMPGMSYHPPVMSYFPRAATAAGWTYEQTIQRLLEHASRRIGKHAPPRDARVAPPIVA